MKKYEQAQGQSTRIHSLTDIARYIYIYKALSHVKVETANCRQLYIQNHKTPGQTEESKSDKNYKKNKTKVLQTNLTRIPILHFTRTCYLRINCTIIPNGFGSQIFSLEMTELVAENVCNLCRV